VKVHALIVDQHVNVAPTSSINRQHEQAPKRTFESRVAPDVKASSEASEFQQQIVKGNVQYALVSADRMSIKFQTVAGGIDTVLLAKPISVGLIDLMIDNGVSVKYASDVDFVKTLQFVGSVVSSGLYWVIGGIIIYSFWTQIRGGGGGGGGIGGGIGGARGFTSAKPPVNPEKVNVRFSDVAGVDNAKVELMEVVEFLKSPERFAKMGAKIPKGCLLSGGPGLGKTLLAKAVAGEAGVPFFAVPASSFVELFVGVGSARVRDLFKQANASAPCIIFIDEIDAIGKSRSSGGGFGGNDEREQTINQLLTEMDGFNGFNGNSGVVVIAATNRPDILDPALVRPGRFDRLITLDPPTLKDREAILGIHTQGKPLSDCVDLYEIAKNTVGLSGAELANIANEAAILAARKNAEKITMSDFTDAIDRVLLGPEKKNSLISEKKKRLVTAHEAGHAVVALRVGEYDAVTKISIVPRGKSGGVTMFEQSPENAESGLYSKRYLENRLAVALGGRAAEEIVFGESNVTTGAYSDMEVVQQLARAMIVNYGFSNELGTVSWMSKGNTFGSEFSEKTMEQIDKEVSDMTKRAYQRAKDIITDNPRLFDEIAAQLYEKEVLDRKDIDAIVRAIV
jgi:cell division protease FtsH